MNEHVFMTRHAFAVPRWQEAFPQARIVAGGERITPAADRIIWLSAELADWRTHLGALAGSGCCVVLLSLQPGEAEALAAFELGARGYAHALATPALLREIDLVVRHGGLWIGPELMGRLLRAVGASLGGGEDAATEELSQRELEVARAVAAGHSNKEIALQLGIAERTVKAHLGAAFDKLGVRDRLQLALRVGAVRLRVPAMP